LFYLINPNEFRATKNPIKKKSALALLRLYRRYPESITAEGWLDKISLLLDESDLGLITSIMGLLIGVAQDNPKPFEPATKKVISILTRVCPSLLALH
jgi:AP-2 complex subunit alpha